MDVDVRNSEPGASILDPHPLHDLADRVGREVELFAEKLDALKPKATDNETTKRISALGLVASYRSAIEDVVEELRQKHHVDQVHALQTRWRQGLHSAAIPDSLVDRRSADERATPLILRSLAEWQEELNTWRLLEDILQSQASTNALPNVDRTSRAKKGRDRFAADGPPWISFLHSDETAEEKLVVLRWLEGCAEQFPGDLDVLEEELEKDSGRGKGLWAQGWIETREKIKAEKRLQPRGSNLELLADIKDDQGQPLAQQLDPDAPSRLNRAIDPVDFGTEKSFWLLSWEMLRRGKSVDSIRDWCEEKNETAKAAMLGLYDPPAGDSDLHASIIARYRWRKACRSAARRGGHNAHERAVFGLLGGDLKTVERVCTTWKDLLYANYNALVLTQYDNYLKSQATGELPSDHVYNFGEKVPLDPSQDSVQILQSLFWSEASDLTAKHAQTLIQRSLIASNFEVLAYDHGLGLGRQALNSHDPRTHQLIRPLVEDSAGNSSADPTIITEQHAIRTLAHVFLILDRIGMDFPGHREREVAENVVLSYVDLLFSNGKFSLIPIYLSTLLGARAAPVLAKVLRAITNATQRQEFVRLMTAYGIDPVEVVILQYELLAAKYLPPSNEFEQNHRFEILKKSAHTMHPGYCVTARFNRPVGVEEENLIQSLEWFLQVDGVWYQTFEALSDAAARFLINGQVQAAIELVNRIPPRTVSTSKSGSLLNRSLDIMDDSNEGTADDRENPEVLAQQRSQSQLKPNISLDHKNERGKMKIRARAYYEFAQLVDAVQALQAWRRAEDRRVEEKSPDGKINEDSQQQARKTMDSLKAAMEPVLRKGFLVGLTAIAASNIRTAEDLDASRRLHPQANDIRLSYLPGVVIAYNTALCAGAHIISREYFFDSLALGDVVATDEELTSCFVSTGRMRELVDSLALTNKALLKLNEGKQHNSKRRGKGPRTLGVWDV